MKNTVCIFRRGFKGFTLVELIITLAIAAILITMAVPSFQDLIRSNQITGQANELITALTLARSEAIKRGERVTLCKRSGNACSKSANWEDGWIVFTDTDDHGVINDDGNATPCEPNEDDECVLHVHEKLSNGATLRTGGTFADWVAYLPSGASRGSGGLSNDTFRLCPQEKDTRKARAIKINMTGRPRVIKGEDFAKEEITCP